MRSRVPSPPRRLLVLLPLVACAPPTAGPGAGPLDTAADTGEPCVEGELRDGEACVPEACGLGPWGDLPVDATTVYVQAGSDGDGSASAPLGSIQTGADLAGARGGGLVAIAAGEYEEAVVLGVAHDQVELAGRCAALVTVAARGSEDTPTVYADGERGSGPDLTLRGLTLTGDGFGMWVEHASLRLADAVVDGAVGAGLVLSNRVDAQLERVTVRGTRSTRARSLGRGIDVEWDATLRATDSLVTGNQEVGVLLGTDSSVAELVDTVVSSTLPDARGLGGDGIDVQYGARLTMTGGAVRGNVNVGVSVLGEGSIAALSGVELADNLPDADGRAGHGLDVGDGGSATLAECLVTGNSFVGIGAFGSGSAVHVERTVIADTRGGTPGSAGVGFAVLGAAEGTVVDTTITDTRGMGVFVADAGTEVTLTRVTVVGTRRPTDYSMGFGLVAQEGARLLLEGGAVRETEGPGAYVTDADLTLDGVALEGNSFAGALAVSAPASLTIARSTITGTGADAEYGGGFGVYSSSLYGPTTLTLTDSTVGPHRYAGVWLEGDGAYRVVGNDLAGGPGFALGTAIVHGNAVYATNGVSAGDGSTGLYLAENLLHDAGTFALLLHGASARLEANDWSANAVDVLQQACETTTTLTADDLAGVPVGTVCPDGNTLVDLSVQFETIYLPEPEIAG